MVRVLTGAIETVLLGLAAYNLAIAAFGWRNARAAGRSSDGPRLRVLIPAHNEEAVLAGLLSGLAAQDYPGSLTRVVVLADRCTDSTAEVARSASVAVLERSGGPEGKGALLAWALDREPLATDEALVVLDADNRVSRDFLSRLAGELAKGSQAVQAYLDVSNPDESAVATASALSYWASNRMVQLARSNLGWPADLGGTGMGLSASAIEAAGGFGDSFAEDQELGVRLFLAGIRVGWLHDVKVYDEKPRTARVAVRQRSRWASGRREVARRYVGRLLRARSVAGWDLALRLVQPSRMGVAVLSLAMAVLSALGLPLLRWEWWALAAAVQALAPIPFLARDGVPGRYLVRYPVLLVLPLLKIPARLRRRQGWSHTPHG